MYELVLASQSPRRRQILQERGYSFETLSIEVSEIPNKNLNEIAQIEDLAHQKARVGVEQAKLLKLNNKIILSADTVVLFQGRLLGKPKNESHAEELISELSGASTEWLPGIAWSSWIKVESSWVTIFQKFGLKNCKSSRSLTTLKRESPWIRQEPMAFKGWGEILLKNWKALLKTLLGCRFKK